LEFWQSDCWRLRLRLLLGTENNVAASLKNFVQQNHRSRDEGGTHVSLCHCKSYDQRCGSVRGLQTNGAAIDGEVRWAIRCPGGPIHVLEGAWPRKRLIIAEFPSMERAQQLWVSPEYAEPKALRQATADSELVIVQGV
jgi:hypothetical protein